jgi:sugar phosphate isomerase/epimerase
MVEMTRRQFIGNTALGTAALSLEAAWGQDPRPAWKSGGFTKILQDLSFPKTAEVASEIGWEGIECPIRAKGHILPERVGEDLPRLMEALKAKRLELFVVATDIRGTEPPETEKVLRAAAREGIRLYRLGAMRYKEGTSIPRQLDEFRARLKDLVALNKELGVTGLIQNHSGNGYVGAAIWDIYELIKDLDPQQMGVHFDIGHATLESGLSWPTSFALVKDRIGAVIVKDFAWKFVPGEGDKPDWCPLGRGTLHPKFFAMLRASGFRGPITAQYEYPIEGGEALEARIRSLKEDHRKLQEWIKV